MDNRNQSGCKLSLILAGVAVVFSILSYCCPKKTTDNISESAFNEKVKSIVVDTIKQNTQMVMEAIGDGIAKKREDTVKQISEDVYNQKDQIIKQSMKFGKLAGAKTSIMCFFDPLCKHCIEFQRSMIKIVNAKKDAAFYMVPVEVLGAESLNIAKIYVSVYEKKGADTALAFIENFTSQKGAINEESVRKAMKAVDLSMKDIESSLSAADEAVGLNGRLAGKLRLPVVPSIFVIKNQDITMIQTVAVDQLLKIIETKTLDGVVSDSPQGETDFANSEKTDDTNPVEGKDKTKK